MHLQLLLHSAGVAWQAWSGTERGNTGARRTHVPHEGALAAVEHHGQGVVVVRAIPLLAIDDLRMQGSGSGGIRVRAASTGADRPALLQAAAQGVMRVADGTECCCAGERLGMGNWRAAQRRVPCTLRQRGWSLAAAAAGAASHIVRLTPCCSEL